MSHELARAFSQAGEPLDARLTVMLEEHCSHRTERRGCGYTQATRFLAEFVNQPRANTQAVELAMFASRPAAAAERLAETAIAAGWDAGWRRLSSTPAHVLETLDPDTARTLIDLDGCVQGLSRIALGFESRLLLALMVDLLRGADASAPVLRPMADKPEIGSCSQAEEFFLEIAHGKIRRGGSVNIVLDDAGEPLLVEKMHLGESHSALALGPVRLNDVAIPAGALFALRHDESTARARSTACGLALSRRDIAAARFLRLTTLAVAPDIRHRAFSAQLEAQVRSNMVSPASTTLDHLRSFARAMVRRAA